MSRNITGRSCARHGFVRRSGVRFIAAAGIAAITPGLSVEPAVRAAADDATYRFAGTVVDPHGKPVAGAKVWFDYALARRPAQPAGPDAVSDAEGKFQFSRAKSGLSEMPELVYGTMGVLVATKDGFGFAAGSADRFETTGRLAADWPKFFRLGPRLKREGMKKDPVLRLTLDDVPLQGKLVNTDGQPVAGATVEAVAVWEGDDGTLDAWEAALKKQPGWRNISILFWRYIRAEGWNYRDGRRDFFAGARLQDVHAEPVASVRSDRAGQFTLKGIGRERVVELLIRAAGFEVLQQFARTRAGEPIDRRNGAARGFDEIAPSTFTFVLGPSVPIEGRVVESGTGRALAGVRVSSPTDLTARTVTDAEGRYRLEGIPVGVVTLDVSPPSGTRNFPVAVIMSTGRRTTALTHDIALPAGVLVHGRAIDERTGKPVQGSLSYFAWESNPELRNVKELDLRSVGMAATDAEGRFAMPALAGPGILAFLAGPRFRHGVGADQINCPTYGNAVRARAGKIFRTIPRRLPSESFNLLVPLDPRPDAREITVDLKLRSGVDVTARVRTSDGQPLGTYYVLGADERRFPWMKQDEDRFTIVGCYPDETRRLFLYQPARNLVASADVTGVPPESIEIRLRPGGTVIGRLIDPQGDPIEGASLARDTMPRRAAAGHLAEMKRDRGVVPDIRPYVKTDGKGRFEMKGLIPGLKYSARLIVRRRSGNVSTRGLMPIFTDLTVRSGETKDVGDVRAKPPEP
jgi:protocatechuate 3,4-dioxygenase beta subunit